MQVLCSLWEAGDVALNHLRFLITARISLRLDRYASLRPSLLSPSEFAPARSPAPGRDTDDL